MGAQPHMLRQEVKPMKMNDGLVVRCEYTQDGKILSVLLEESFRLYVTHILKNAGETGNSCEQ